MQVYQNIEDGDSMYNSLAEQFKRNGHNITVVASSVNNSTGIRNEGGFNVLRVKTLSLFRVHPYLKGIANLLIGKQFGRAIKAHLGDKSFDLIVTPTPPITLTFLTSRLKRKFKATTYLILRDIFPQNAIDIGLLTKWNPIYYFFRFAEKHLYRNIDHIGCMTFGNIRYLIEKNPSLDVSKIHLLPNWNKCSEIKGEDNSDIIEKHGLKDKFIAIFGGNIGLPQKVENIIELAKIHLDKKDLFFIIVGRGTQKAILMHLAKENKLTNLLFIDHLKREEYEKYVKLSNIGLISLNENFTIPNIPSRTLSYYNYKLPVFAIVDKVTDYPEMLEVDKSGLSCICGDFESYKEKFDKLYYNKELRCEMGENGYKALVSKYNPESAYNTIMSEIK